MGLTGPHSQGKWPKTISDSFMSFCVSLLVLCCVNGPFQAPAFILEDRGKFKKLQRNLCCHKKGVGLKKLLTSSYSLRVRTLVLPTESLLLFSCFVIYRWFYLCYLCYNMLQNKMASYYVGGNSSATQGEVIVTSVLSTDSKMFALNHTCSWPQYSKFWSQKYTDLLWPSH